MGLTEFGPVSCGKCRSVLEENRDVDPEEREPCPSCGSKSRHFSITVSDTITVRGSLSARAASSERRPGERKYFYEGRSGEELHHKSGEWRYVEQAVDRRRNLYRKKVVRPGGEVIKDVTEPLDEHRSGDAAPSSPPSDDAGERSTE